MPERSTGPRRAPASPTQQRESFARLEQFARKVASQLRTERRDHDSVVLNQGGRREVQEQYATLFGRRKTRTVTRDVDPVRWSGAAGWLVSHRESSCITRGIPSGTVAEISWEQLWLCQDGRLLYGFLQEHQNTVAIPRRPPVHHMSRTEPDLSNLYLEAALRFDLRRTWRTKEYGRGDTRVFEGWFSTPGGEYRGSRPCASVSKMLSNLRADKASTNISWSWG